MKENLALRERYLKDPLPVRLGGLAANLARVRSFSNDPRHERLVAGMLEESKWFIEWAAAGAPPDIQGLLVECQRQLARWQMAWSEIWQDVNRRAEVAETARTWSGRILQASELLEASPTLSIHGTERNNGMQPPAHGSRRGRGRALGVLIKPARTVALGFLLLLSACLYTLETTPAQVEAEISAALNPGASSTEIQSDPAARVTVKSEGWELVGDLQTPKASGKVPGVLLLNKAAGDRHVYKALAGYLADRGIASLRLDLRGHGESTNLGRFIPDQATDKDRETMIWSAEADVVAAHRFLKSHPRIDARRIGVVGGSYSGEEMAEAGRLVGYAQAYVALSPGSFSEESIAAMDPSGIPWLFIVSRHERHLTEIAAAVQSRTKDVEIVYIPGEQHATRILEARPDVAERIAVWLASKLSLEKRNEE